MTRPQGGSRNFGAAGFVLGSLFFVPSSLLLVTGWSGKRRGQRAEGRDGCRRSEFRKAEERAWFLVLSSLLLVLCSWDLSGGGVVNAGVNAGEAEREALGGKRCTDT